MSAFAKKIGLQPGRQGVGFGDIDHRVVVSPPTASLASSLAALACSCGEWPRPLHRTVDAVGQWPRISAEAPSPGARQRRALPAPCRAGLYRPYGQCCPARAKPARGAEGARSLELPGPAPPEATRSRSRPTSPPAELASHWWQ